MDTRLSPDNPFGFNRYGFAWEKITRGSHLDYGCYDGAFLGSLESRELVRRVGVDVSAQAITAARRRWHGIEFEHIRAGESLPFADGSFDSISLMDVLEHVSDQGGLLAELHRLLNEDGLLVVTVPQQHALSFLDLGNFKFRFPRMHRWFYRLRHSEDQYRERYVANADGLVGDISAEKRWHEHFTSAHLAGLLQQSGFQVECFDGTGFWMRAIRLAELPFKCIPPAAGALRALTRWDARVFRSANLFCTARKATVREDEASAFTASISQGS